MRSPRVRKSSSLVVGLAVGLVLAAGCAAPQGAGDADGDRQHTVILADAYKLTAFNPLQSHARIGVSPFYEALYRPVADTDAKLPDLEPALATAQPTVDAAGLTWRVPLRTGVTFHDGTPFDSADVVAAYQAILDPQRASPMASDFEMIAGVSAQGPEAVTFRLRYPYADFQNLLLTPIPPSEKIGTGLMADSSLNTHPVGTGPYRVKEISAEKLVAEANPDYWGGAPTGITTLIRLYLPDENTRAQRVSTGDVDGTVLPPTLAATLDGKDGLVVHSAKSGDIRMVVLPRLPFTTEPAVRRALNHAVDRQAMVDKILGGHGQVISTPVTPAFTDLYDPAATFAHDPDKARQLLDAAGWRPGPDGIRVKDGQRAAFPLAYSAENSVRRDLSVALAADLKKVGVEVTLDGSTYEKIEPRLGSIGHLQGGGSRPYSADYTHFSDLHRRTSGRSSPWDNPANFGSAELDAALEDGRRARTPQDRQRAYRTAQRLYLDDPFAIFLLALNHTYVARPGGWTMTPPFYEGHGEDVDWGPWRDLAAWHR